VDSVEISVKAGDGGDGVVSFRREAFVPFGGPDGGDGGNGGNVYVKASRNLAGLSAFRYKRAFKAESGKNGAGKKRFGKKGVDLEIEVPMGTTVYRLGDADNMLLGDLIQQGQRILVARGGRGGLGNVHFVSSTNQAPEKATKGEKGEELRLLLDLKIIADVGLIGYPNVGKSTLLAAVSAARPKAANYPFTTLVPVLGEVQSGKRVFVLAEIPGLIEGAHRGRGLGHDFLRHAERTKILLHIVDGTSMSMMEDLSCLNRELALYKTELAEKLQIVAVSKVDLPEVQARLPGIEEIFESHGLRVHLISGVTGQGLKELMLEIDDMLDEIDLNKAEPELPPAVFHPKPKTRGAKRD